MKQSLQDWGRYFITAGASAGWFVSGFPQAKVIVVQAIPTDGVPGVQLEVTSETWQKIIDANGSWDWGLTFWIHNLNNNGVVYEIYALVTTN